MCRIGAEYSAHQEKNDVQNTYSKYNKIHSLAPILAFKPSLLWSFTWIGHQAEVDRLTKVVDKT